MHGGRMRRNRSAARQLGPARGRRPGTTPSRSADADSTRSTSVRAIATVRRCRSSGHRAATDALARRSRRVPQAPRSRPVAVATRRSATARRHRRWACAAIARHALRSALGAGHPEVLWTPPDRRPRALAHGPLPRLAGRRAGAGVRDLRRRLALVGRRARRVLAVDLGPLRRPLDRPPGPALADPRMPGARWFPDALINYAEHALRLPGRSPDDVVIVARSQTREPVELTAAALRDAVARCRAGLLRLGVRARRPRRRVRAQHPRGGRSAFLATRQPRARPGRRARPSSATGPSSTGSRQIEPTVLLAVDGYRYGDKAIDRSGRGRRRSAPPCRASRRPSSCPTSDPSRGRRGRPGAVAWSELLAEPGAARLRPRPVRPPAVRAVLVGDDRAAQADRPRPRRHPPRAPQGARAPHGPRAGRPVLLVHDDRLDDVELPRVRARSSGSTLVLFDGNPAWPDLSTLWRLAADDRDDVPRRQRPVPHGLPGAPACGPGATCDLATAARRRLDRRAAAGGGLPVGARRGVARRSRWAR